LLDTLRGLRREGYTASEIADQLNAVGWRTPTQRNRFNERLVRAMLARYGAPPKGPRRPPSDSRDEWWLKNLAATLQMPVVTLHGWLRREWLRNRRLNGRRVVIANRTELRRLQRLRECCLQYGRWHTVRRPGENGS
jgi:hypothetical protein